MKKNHYTVVDRPVAVKLVRHSGDDKVVVDSARVSLASLEEMGARVSGDDRGCSERDIKLIKYLARHKHLSPFEHCHMTFWVEAPLYVARQHMRHRTWSYNEVSRRYTSDDIRIYEPARYRKQAPTNRQASTEESDDPVVRVIQGPSTTYMTAASTLVAETNRELLRVYAALLEAGVCREQARGVLPQAMMTQYYATVNLRNLSAFVIERTSTDAQSEMRDLAMQMLALAKQHYPESIAALMGGDDV